MFTPRQMEEIKFQLQMDLSKIQNVIQNSTIQRRVPLESDPTNNSFPNIYWETLIERVKRSYFVSYAIDLARIWLALERRMELINLLSRSLDRLEKIDHVKTILNVISLKFPKWAQRSREVKTNSAFVGLSVAFNEDISWLPIFLSQGKTVSKMI